jgi:predicted dehydrogenase
MGQAAHLRNYVTLGNDCQVAAIAEIRTETARLVAQRYAIPHVYGDAAAMLAAEPLDAIVCAQPFQRHGILLPEILRAGKPVFIEKPLAGTLESGRAIVQAVAAGGSFLMVGYHKRSDPATMYAKAEIDRLKATGELGRLTYVRILMPAGDWVANGFLNNVEANDRVPDLAVEPPPTDMDAAAHRLYIEFVNYYIHQVNLLRHLLGEDYRVTYADPAGVLLAAVSDSGVTGAIEMSPYRTTLDWQESAFVCFERGWIRLTLPSPLASNRPGRVEIFRDPGQGVVPTTTEPQLPWVHAMRQQAMNFVAAVRGERPPMCDAATALKDLETAREYLRLWKGK